MGQSDNFDNQHVLLGEDQERTCKLSGELACFGVKCPVATFTREHACFYRLKTGLVDHGTCFCLPQLRKPMFKTIFSFYYLLERHACALHKQKSTKEK